MDGSGENCMRKPSDIVPFNAPCQIKMLEKCLNIFVEFHQSSSSKLGRLENDKLKRYFQIALAIEKALSHLEDIGETSMSSNLIHTMLMDKNINTKYDISFFKKACDELLTKFFTCNESSVFKTEVAVRIYNSILPSHRLESFLFSLLLKSASFKSVEEFVMQNKDLDVKSLQCKLILYDWISEFKGDGYKKLNTVIQEILSGFKVQQSLHILIEIIGLEAESTDEINVRTIVLNEILDKMLCRSILSKKFWLTMFEIDPIILQKACILSEEFHVAICNFLIFVGSMMDMKKEGGQTKWIPNLITSIYPEFTYEFLLKILRYLSNENFSKKDVTKQKLLSAMEKTNCPLWIHFFVIL